MALTKVTSPMTKGQSLTYNIPSDFNTLQEAIDGLSPTFSNDLITLNIESGHQPTSGITVSNGDYSNFQITSTDAEVTLSASFGTSANFIAGTNARMPTLACLINANSKCNIGYRAYYNSYGYIAPNCGVKNAWGSGLSAYGGSVVSADYTIWTGCAKNNTTGSGITSWGSVIFASHSDVSNSMYYGAQAAHGGILVFDNSTANNCFRYCLRATDAGWMSADAVTANYAGCDPATNLPYAASAAEGLGIYAFNGSWIAARDAVANHAKRSGCLATNGSTIQAIGGDFSYAGEEGAHASTGSTLSINSSNLSYSGTYGLYVTTNSKASAGLVNCNNSSGVGIYVANASSVNANSATANNCTGTAAIVVTAESSLNFSIGSATGATNAALFITQNSRCNAASATLTGAGTYAVYCTSSEVNATSATATGAGTNGILCQNGGRATAVLGNFQKGGSPASSDIVIADGGIIAAKSATGGLSTTANAITSAGIIFQ